MRNIDIVLWIKKISNMNTNKEIQFNHKILEVWPFNAKTKNNILFNLKTTYKKKNFLLQNLY